MNVVIPSVAGLVVGAVVGSTITYVVVSNQYPEPAPQALQEEVSDEALNQDSALNLPSPEQATTAYYRLLMVDAGDDRVELDQCEPAESGPGVVCTIKKIFANGGQPGADIVRFYEVDGKWNAAPPF